MNIKRYTLADIPKVCIPLGVAGEHLATRIEIDCTPWLTEHPDAVVALLIRQPDGNEYLKEPTMDGSLAMWTLEKIDTGVPGYGRMEVRCNCPVGSQQYISASGRTHLYPSIGSPGGGDPSKPWVDVVLNARAEAVAAATASAEQAAQTGEYAQQVAKDREVVAADREAAENAIEAVAADREAVAADRKAVEAASSKIDGAVANIDSYAGYVVNGDWTAAVAAALAENDSVYIGRDIEVHGTVRMGDRKSITLGAVTITKPATANDTRPVFIFDGSGSSIRGVGKQSTRISTNNASPGGVIRFGPDTQNGMNRSANNNTLYGVSVTGVGRAAENIGVYLFGARIPNHTVYFETVKEVLVRACGTGIKMEGQANGNSIEDILLWDCGSLDDDTGVTGAGFALYGYEYNGVVYAPVENNISNVFHHGAADAKSIYIACDAYYNTFLNYKCEQSGNRAYALYVEDDCNVHDNTFELVGNTALGSRIDAVARRENIFLGRGAATMRTVSVNAITYNRAITPLTRRYELTASKLAEDATHDLLTVQRITGLSTYTPSIIRIMAMHGDFARTGHLYRASEVEYALQLPAYNAQKPDESKIWIAQEMRRVDTVRGETTRAVIMNWVDNTLRFKVPNNGTNTSDVEAWFVIEIIGPLAADESNVTFGDTFTVL